MQLESMLIVAEDISAHLSLIAGSVKECTSVLERLSGANVNDLRHHGQ